MEGLYVWFFCIFCFVCVLHVRMVYRLVGPVVKASASRAEDPGLESCLPHAGIFPGSSHTSDLKIGAPVVTLPGTWRYRVSS